MDVLATGYPSLDYIIRVTHSPKVGETALMTSSPDHLTYGGCGANIAVAMARLGFTTGVAMVIGQDAHGDQYIKYLMQSGVNISNVIRLPGHRTSTSYLFLNEENQHQNFFLPGAADVWQDDLSLNQLNSYRLAVVTVGPLKYNRQFVKLVQHAELPLAWELKPDIFAYPPDVIEEFLMASTYVLMNHIEAKYVLDVMKAQDVRELFLNITQAIVVTKGEKGVTVYIKEGQQDIPAVPPKDLVDPTGAGDSFTAGFLSGILRQKTPVEAAQWGVVLASFCIEALGCQTNLPEWREFERRHNAQFGEV